MRLPLPEPNILLQLLQHGKLEDRLRGLDPVTAVYYAAAPVLLTLRVVPLQGTLPVTDDWSTVDKASPWRLAIENLVRLPEDLQRLRQAQSHNGGASSRPVDDLELNGSIRKILREEDVKTIGELSALSNSQLREFDGMNAGQVAEIIARLTVCGYK